jgi:hypothetical protein
LSEPKQVIPREAAELLVWALEARGAMFKLLPDGYFRCDLNGARIATLDQADDVARVVLALRDEIRAHLRTRHVTH